MWFIVLLLIILILFPYIFYPLILMLLPKKYKKRPDKEVLLDKSVSLYIAAYNEEKVIAEKLENSLSLDTVGISLEIVVGSDGSTDRTNEIVEKYIQKYSNVRLLNFKDRAGKVNVLNRGIPQCHGDIVVLSDANAMYNLDALQKIIPHFQDEQVGCVAGEKRVIDGNGAIGNNEGMYWKLEAKIKFLEAMVATVIGADGACYAIRKELFCTLPTDTAVDDFLLSMKIVEQGYRISYEPNAFSYEDTGSDVNQELKRKVRIAAGNFSNFRELNRFLQFDLISFMYVAHKVLRWISPLFFLLLTTILLIMSVYDFLAWIILIVLLFTYLIGYCKYNKFFSLLTENKVGKIISYFYITTWAQWLGYKKYKMGTQKAMWETIR